MKNFTFEKAKFEVVGGGRRMRTGGGGRCGAIFIHGGGRIS
jgi:hypothetical protein